MRRAIFVLTFLILAAGAAKAAGSPRALVAVFSRADENYNVGFIEEGNTRVVAGMIAERTGADLFEIRAASPYPRNYKECTEAAQKELSANARPALAEDKDISGYDTIFLGYPIWWGELPMAVYTFLEAHDFKGKTVVPFATHEGSGMGRTEGSLRRALPGAKILKGLAIRGATAQNSRDQARKSVTSWLSGLGF
ncbi:MAG: flavodoxin [Fretibacterium sp.]|nr:flavodoxin [Fretibacterium sp.]